MVRSWYELPEYVRLRRVSGLRLSPDGTRLVAPVSGLSPDGTSFRSALWEIDVRPEAEGGRAPRRLTRGAKGEAAVDFLPDGSVLFTSARPDAEAAEPEEKPKASLWLLPADGGEARQVASRPGGIGAFTVARDSGLVSFASDTLLGSGSEEEDRAARKARAEAGVSAILHEELPVRHWDSDIGPGRPRRFVAEPPADEEARLGEPRDLTPDAGSALLDGGSCLTPDGTALITPWRVPAGRGAHRTRIVRVDTATGERSTLLDDPDAQLGGPLVSPDGRLLAYTRFFAGEPGGEPRSLELRILDLESGQSRSAHPGLELWARGYAWSADSRSLFFGADENGRLPVFRADTAEGTVVRLTGDHGSYTELNPSPDGRYVYALRDAWDAPPAPVRLDAGAVDGQPVHLRTPGSELTMPGTLTEIEATADDGTRVRSWLVLPEEASADSPAPLLLWVHGGPYMSFNGWSWRWNPWLMAARGYAVLLPDPALSTGYGQDMLRRAWGRWGERVFADLMAVTDAAVARDDIDGERTAVMGGSFGGYMANWIAGHTDRFRAVVTHASLWGLDAFGGTTDYPPVWESEFGTPLENPELYERNSPHLHAADIRTPVLVIHGDKDYRVPIGEGLRLWRDLLLHGVEAKFLYFPDENHWILTPGNARIWYETILAFLDHHVHGKEWNRPGLL
ncbi:S9 family peptidase [Nocardiopsis algeriensis]|uniref:Dipeptidyl aminopeptidase/acylaminoacyl peptidase n=1 Tax=Nocardiopsis algeriensis TaxID=1478215 RepID=A0A841INC0_9ACTN|nr:S9 family peptidase [Nocardiopsis algeriensis]MBB6119670.1 dipeptidyl aminopeptidase/acylaminoacyl peptidase [Nocardiopsis algeriensis]